MSINKTLDLASAKQLLKTKAEAFAKNEDFDLLTEIHTLSGWIADSYRILRLVPENWDRGGFEIHNGLLNGVWYYADHAMVLEPAPDNSHTAWLQRRSDKVVVVEGIRADDTLRKLFATDLYQDLQG